jgi:hypothetical protein
VLWNKIRTAVCRAQSKLTTKPCMERQLLRYLCNPVVLTCCSLLVASRSKLQLCVGDRSALADGTQVHSSRSKAAEPKVVIGDIGCGGLSISTTCDQ